MQNKATDLFSDWAEVGRDKGMADAHDPAVSEILDKILKIKKLHLHLLMQAVVMAGLFVRFAQCQTAILQ